MKTSVGINLARSIFSVIDKAIYSLIAAIYNIIEELASNQQLMILLKEYMFLSEL